MVCHRAQYETLLATYCDQGAAIALLKRHRAYLELLPSMRRPQESLVVLPFPLIEVSESRWQGQGIGHPPMHLLPCELALLMCDPDWKVKTGVEIFIFIHRPQEDFSDLLYRWRQTQIALSQSYQWHLPPQHHYLFNEGAEKLLPLFVLLEQSWPRIRSGLQGAGLPFVVHETPSNLDEEPSAESFSYPS